MVVGPYFDSISGYCLPCDEFDLSLSHLNNFWKVLRSISFGFFVWPLHKGLSS